MAPVNFTNIAKSADKEPWEHWPEGINPAEALRAGFNDGGFRLGRYFRATADEDSEE
jgi:hypothetical protein